MCPLFGGFTVKHLKQQISEMFLSIRKYFIKRPWRKKIDFYPISIASLQLEIHTGKS